ncbi:MAG: M14 family zinc carboxypeptidase [Candidatus Aminicenantales bacterium]
MSKDKQGTKVVLSFFLLAALVCFSGSQSLKTPAEESRYTAYSQHEDVARFLSVLDHFSPQVTVQVIGRTREVREFSAHDLFLVILTEEGVDAPGKLNRAKPTILFVASQHGNEQSAKEATLRLCRDLALGELKSLLRKANVLAIPQANPYGNWFDRRQNEQDLDLNRDHVKLESEETQAIHRVFSTWQPEVTMDVHEKGDDYYRVSIGCVSNANIHPRLQEFSRTRILAAVEKSLEKKRIPFHEYLVTQEMGIDSSAGVRYREEELAGREVMMRYSTADLNDGRNSLGIFETLSFIQEGASRHDLKTLEQRTDWQYAGLRAFLEAIAEHGQEVNILVRELRRQLLEKAGTYTEEDLVHLRMDYGRDEKEPTLSIKKFERAETPIRGILKVDKKAGDLLTAGDVVPYPFPAEQKVKIELVKNWFPIVKPTLSVPRPLGYIVPSKHQPIIEVLLKHALQVDLFARDAEVEVEAYSIKEVVPSGYDYLPPEKIEVEKKSIPLLAKRGDYYVDCRQAGANLIPCLLEPQSQFGLIRYWAFKLVPEKGDFFAFFRLTKPSSLPLVPYRRWVP